MDQRDSYCPYLLFSETTVVGTGTSVKARKEDPELNGVKSKSIASLLVNHYRRQEAKQPGTREAK